MTAYISYSLENKGWLAATWQQTDAGRDTKVYRLTAKGRRQLDDEVAEWARVSQGIQLILSTTE